MNSGKLMGFVTSAVAISIAGRLVRQTKNALGVGLVRFATVYLGLLCRTFFVGVGNG